MCICPHYMQLWPLTSSSSPIFSSSFFHHIHLKAFYLPCKFWIQWRIVRGLKKNWNILWQLVIAPITHSMVRNFDFSIKFQFFYQNTQLEVAYNVLKLDFESQWIWHVCWARGWLQLPPCTWDYFPAMTFEGLKDHQKLNTFSALSPLKNEYIWKSSIFYQKYIPFKCRNCQTVTIVLLTDKCPQLNPIFEICPCNVYLHYVQPCCCRPPSMTMCIKHEVYLVKKNISSYSYHIYVKLFSKKVTFTLKDLRKKGCISHLKGPTIFTLKDSQKSSLSHLKGLTIFCPSLVRLDTIQGHWRFQM